MMHTPGKWEVAENGTFVYAIDADTEVNRFSASIEGGYTRKGKTSIEELKGNGRLIAAAPDLLAACKQAIYTINSHTTEPIPVGAYNLLARMLVDAIAKAE